MKSLSKIGIVVFSCVLFIYGYSSMNIGLPAYPMLEEYFQASAEHVKLSMTVFLLGFSTVQLFWGTFSDRFGRRKTVLIGTIITIIGSLLTAYASTISFFIIGRFVEAIGSGFTPVMARAILSDSLNSKLLLRAMSFIVAVVAILPALAPLLGGEIIHLSGNWQSIYYFLTLGGLIFLIYEYFKLPETHLNLIKKLSLKHTFHIYRSILSHSYFLGYFLSISLVMGGLITFYAVAPYIFVLHLNISADTYGYFLMIICFSYISGSLIANRLSKYLALNKIIACGFLLTYVAAILLIIFSLNSQMTIISAVLPMAIYALGCGCISPISNVCAILAIKKNYGSLGAILGAGSILTSSILSGILAPFSMETLVPLTIFIASISGISSIIFYNLIIKMKYNPTEDNIN